MVDSRGEPLPAVDVLAYYEPATGRIAGQRLLTDRDGMFVFSRRALPMWIRLATPDGKLTRVVKIDAD